MHLVKSYTQNRVGWCLLDYMHPGRDTFVWMKLSTTSLLHADSKIDPIVRTPRTWYVDQSLQRCTVVVNPVYRYTQRHISNKSLRKHESTHDIRTDTVAHMRTYVNYSLWNERGMVQLLIQAEITYYSKAFAPS